MTICWVRARSRPPPWTEVLQELSPRQKEAVWGSNSWINIFDGSVRAGKTVASLVRWIKKVRESPDGDFLMVGKTERTLKRNAIDPLISWLGPERCRLHAGSGELTLLGRRVYLAGANDERSETKIRGLGLVGAYADEITTWPESFWTMLLSRLSDADAQLIGTTNPDHPSHWLKKDYLDRAGELDLYRVKFRLRDNTSLTEKYIKNITASYTGLWRKRYIDGEWVAAEGAVYGDVWNPDVHVERDVPALVRVWSGIDYGTTNPFVEILVGLGVDGRLHAMGEWRWDSKLRQRTLTAGQYGNRLRNWHGKLGIEPEWMFVDPEEAAFRVELQQSGWKGVRPAANSVLEGIRLQADLLVKDKFRVHESCEGLIDEFPGYVWDPDAEEDRPIKVDDHSLDAGRYGVLSSEFIWNRRIRLHEEAA